MHKIRKLLLSLLLFPLALVSCGGNKYYGHYAFQMGSDRSSHFGVFVDLKKEDYIVDREKKGEYFKFGARLSEDMVPDFPEEDPDDPARYLEEVFMYMMIQLLNVEQDSEAGLTGYYTVGKKQIGEKGFKVDLNIILEGIEADIPKDLLEKFLISYLNGNILNIILPVSVPDFQRQLCWYGTYIDFNLKAIDPDDMVIIEELPGEGEPPLPGPQGEDRIGTHPTEIEIEEMNELYGETHFKKDGRNFKFKDFNTLTVGLLKS